MLTTAELVLVAQSGEKCAFAELVRRYERSAIVTAHAVLGDFHAAQDAAQDGFVAAYQRIRDLREADAFGPWLLQIVRRRAIEMSKKAAAVARTPLGEASVPNNADSWLAKYDDVVQQLDRLPEHERCVVLLRYLDGHTVADVAQLTGRPIGTVTKQISRAIERLRTWLVEVSP
jgi:RNA polymerase sigma-70 factor (ECF subfamily)